ncbi:MAG: hypothetical protein ACTSVI_05240 [Promethearchaeota archaeon]
MIILNFLYTRYGFKTDNLKIVDQWASIFSSIAATFTPLTIQFVMLTTTEPLYKSQNFHASRSAQIITVIVLLFGFFLVAPMIKMFFSASMRKLMSW